MKLVELIKQRGDLVRFASVKIFNPPRRRGGHTTKSWHFLLYFFQQLIDDPPRLHLLKIHSGIQGGVGRAGGAGQKKGRFGRGNRLRLLRQRTFCPTGPRKEIKVMWADHGVCYEDLSTRPYGRAAPLTTPPISSCSF